MSKDREIVVDDMGLAFAKTMTIFTIVGVVLMVIPAIAYFMGINQYVSLTEAHKYWNMSASEFWMHVTGKKITGYAWIFNNLDKTDCLSMIGVLILMITPLLSMLAGAAKAKGTYRILLLVASLVFIASILAKSAVVAGAKAGAKAVKAKVGK